MKFSFFNKNLQDIHSLAEQSITSRLAKLDEVSNDIKALEAILSKSGLSVTFLYLFEELSEKKYRRLDEFDKIGVNRETKHYMVWDRDKQRLLYEIYEKETEIVEPSKETQRYWGPFRCHSKPLIETKTHIRLKALPELQDFYNHVIKLLGQGQVHERIEVRSPKLDECPF